MLQHADILSQYQPSVKTTVIAPTGISGTVWHSLLTRKAALVLVKHPTVDPGLQEPSLTLSHQDVETM